METGGGAHFRGSGASGLAAAEQLFCGYGVAPAQGADRSGHEELLPVRAGFVSRAALGTATGTPAGTAPIHRIAQRPFIGSHVSVFARTGAEVRISIRARATGAILARRGGSATGSVID